MSAIASYSFQSKTILITGGAGDIGKATAHRFAENGGGIMLLNINEAKISEVVSISTI
ncbi:SDR family NAD(P)-dependent oxidoreductase [Pleurocapsa sp. PCC 7319]|uniref:SDR family NAD(P)-dependent oxidoreductase n=1 Tax=Pleurocapsa sp. PCC 7319 TaxID=118161 RepID=UPI0003460F61|nr:SDR family NAD(P)-dependent oxidoreductase [Pleurocapsa sp. PCC 7319]